MFGAWTLARHVDVLAEAAKVAASEPAREIGFAALVVVGLVASEFVAVAHSGSPNAAKAKALTRSLTFGFSVSPNIKATSTTSPSFNSAQCSMMYRCATGRVRPPQKYGSFEKRSPSAARWVMALFGRPSHG